MTGEEERGFAGWLASELTALGAEGVTLKDFAPGRPNVWARLKGKGGGPRLLMIGHTDTVHVRGWAERWAATERADPFGGAIVDGAIWGRGSGDLKAGICTTLAAARLVRDAGLRLPEEIVFAFVGDEESGEPGSGVSAGMKAFSRDRDRRRPRPEAAIYVEPTQLNVYAAQMGFLICDITITGKSAYFGVPELGVDALKAGHAVLSALWRHSAALEALPPHPLVGRPFLLVTAFTAGGYIAVPGECRHQPDPETDAGAKTSTRPVPGWSRPCAARRSSPPSRLAFAYPAGRDHASAARRRRRRKTRPSFGC